MCLTVISSKKVWLKNSWPPYGIKNKKIFHFLMQLGLNAAHPAFLCKLAWFWYTSSLFRNLRGFSGWFNESGLLWTVEILRVDIGWVKTELLKITKIRWLNRSSTEKIEFSGIWTDLILVGPLGGSVHGLVWHRARESSRVWTPFSELYNVFVNVEKVIEMG